MRTTINIDDDVYEQVSAFARQRKLPVGRVVSETLRQTFRSARVTEDPDEWPYFEPPPDAPRIRSEDVHQAMAEDDLNSP